VFDSIILSFGQEVEIILAFLLNLCMIADQVPEQDGHFTFNDVPFCFYSLLLYDGHLYLNAYNVT